jgi:hypothetical protein
VIEDARIQRLKDQTAKELNAGEKFMLVNPALIIMLCEGALKNPELVKAVCPSCGQSVDGSWTDGIANCRSCSWRGAYPEMR